MTTSVVGGATAPSVFAVLSDLPEPIPERVVHGYLNDELAGECLRAGLFYTPTCRWCLSLFNISTADYFTCPSCNMVPKHQYMLLGQAGCVNERSPPPGMNKCGMKNRLPKYQ
jgi:hypothetical protein